MLFHLFSSRVMLA